MIFTKFTPVIALYAPSNGIKPVWQRLLWTSYPSSRCGQVLRRFLGRRLYECTEMVHFQLSEVGELEADINEKPVGSLN